LIANNSIELSQNSILVILSFCVPMKENCAIDNGPRPPS